MSDSATMSGFNEHDIRETTVNDKRLQQHRGFDQGYASTARRLLTDDEAVTRARVAKHTFEIHIKGADALHWTAPDGYRIESFSAFLDADEWDDNQSLIVALEQEDD